jgi:hypothetical protein
MKTKTQPKAPTLTKTTLRRLTPADLGQVAGGEAVEGDKATIDDPFIRRTR